MERKLLLTGLGTCIARAQRLGANASLAQAQKQTKRDECGRPLPIASKSCHGVHRRPTLCVGVSGKWNTRPSLRGIKDIRRSGRAIRVDVARSPTVYFGDRD